MRIKKVSSDFCYPWGDIHVVGGEINPGDKNY